MNCFTHALPFLDDPLFAVGTCVPDWLSACDRKCRVREDAARQLESHSDDQVRRIAAGIVQHHVDDHWFHKTLAFNELSMRFSVEIRDLLGSEAGFRPGLLGHIIVELFLDAYLDHRNPGKLEQYYGQVASIDPDRVQATVNLIATRPTTRLVPFIAAFLEARYLFDYQDDSRLIYRVNQVFRRVGLQPLSDELDAWLPEARKLVYQQIDPLLAEYVLDVG